jgi:ketosteroid isomerase-like protein
MNASLRGGLGAALLALPLASALADTRSEVLQAEEQFAQALATRSRTAMTAVLSPDFLYQHVTGNTYTRDDIVRLFGGGEITVRKAGPLQAALRDYGSTVVTHGTRWFEGELQGQPYAGTLRFVNVWHRDADGRWRLTHRNSELLN